MHGATKLHVLGMAGVNNERVSLECFGWEVQ